MTQEREPLLHAMTKASGALLDQTFGEATHRQCWAAEIRALRDWLVPEEPRVFRPDCTLDEYEEARVFYRHGERQRLRALLTAEAERAEKGE